MDLSLTEQQVLLRDSARSFLAGECPESHVRDMEVDPRGFSPQLWGKMAQQGWQGLIVPPEYEGVGMDFMDLVVLVEEFGRALVPGPFIPNSVATLALIETANEQQKAQWLPPIAAGTDIWTVAFTEGSGRFDAGGVELTARREGDSYVLNGTKVFVRDSHVADRLVVVARTGGKDAEGISLFAVGTNSVGLSQEPLLTIAGDKQNEITFKNVSVPADNLLGAEGNGWQAFQSIATRATILECAYLVGLAQMDFDIALDYAKERVVFGRPIGAFQAIQHKFADMVTDLNGSRQLMYRAASAVANNEPEQSKFAHIAKTWCTDATRRLVAHSQQIHGAIGFTRDYKIQLYYRRQRVAGDAWGNADFHRDLVGRMIADGTY